MIDGPDQIVKAYRTADKQQLRKLLLVEYRCRGNGCLLLHVWRPPGEGPYYYTKPYKVYAGGAVLDSAHGRLMYVSKNPQPGDQLLRSLDGRLYALPPRKRPLHGIERAGLLADLDRRFTVYPLQCAHTRQLEVVARIMADALVATPGRPSCRFLPAQA